MEQQDADVERDVHTNVVRGIEEHFDAHTYPVDSVQQESLNLGLLQTLRSMPRWVYCKRNTLLQIVLTILLTLASVWTARCPGNFGSPCTNSTVF